MSPSSRGCGDERWTWSRVTALGSRGRAAGCRADWASSLLPWGPKNLWACRGDLGVKPSLRAPAGTTRGVPGAAAGPCRAVGRRNRAGGTPQHLPSVWSLSPYMCPRHICTSEGRPFTRPEKCVNLSHPQPQPWPYSATQAGVQNRCFPSRGNLPSCACTSRSLGAPSLPRSASTTPCCLW